ncbi:hypothetical protein DPMN_091233 [Dreissena polymorpha]|uniref:Uncharacterized protein n=1 Tax=Dreissena polymorpha TaxID=45954 RepID=A0A9D4R0I9_DREPO|nr:hypothetical protein DPMN_091233 [Dreissena polymorpha]
MVDRKCFEKYSEGAIRGRRLTWATQRWDEMAERMSVYLEQSRADNTVKKIILQLNISNSAKKMQSSQPYLYQ